MVRTIECGEDKLSTIIRNLQIVVIFIPDEVADDVSSMTSVRQKMWIGYWTSAIKEHCILHQDTPKGYSTELNMFTPRLVTKLEGASGYAQVRSDQDVVGLILLICGICCEYNNKRQDTCAIMKARKIVKLLWQSKDQSNNDYKRVFEALIDMVETYGGTFDKLVLVLHQLAKNGVVAGEDRDVIG